MNFSWVELLFIVAEYFLFTLYVEHFFLSSIGTFFTYYRFDGKCSTAVERTSPVERKRCSNSRQVVLTEVQHDFLVA
jgi:hypothetical protein